MALQDYARLVVFLDGKEVKQAESFEHETESGQQPVLILNEGLGGFTPGSGQTNISGTLYVPIGGFEEPVQKYCAEGSYHVFQFGVGAEAVINSGKFTNVKISQSTNQATQVTFSFIGNKKAFG